MAFIMDGNRRFAKDNNISNQQGYSSGATQLFSMIKLQVKYSIHETSFWALSTENWKMRDNQINELIPTLKKLFKQKEGEVETFCKAHNIFFEIKGDIKELENSQLHKEFSFEILELKKRLEEHNSKISSPKFKINICVNYGGHRELVHAVKKILLKIEQQKLNKETICEQTIKDNIYFNSSPPPDIIIRPGNAPRLSGFMSWDSAYSEIFFSPKMWNELNEDDFISILSWFKTQKRNFGK